MRPAPGLSIEQQSEGVIVRLCLVDEARGERDQGGDLDARPMLAIWHVIRNRALAADSTMKAQVLKPQQFSGFNMEGGHRAQMLDYWKTDPAAWERADAVCDIAEASWTEDPTMGASHYLNRRLCDPPWARLDHGWQKHVQIGSHEFGCAT